MASPTDDQNDNDNGKGPRPVPTHIKSLDEVSAYLRGSYVPVNVNDTKLGYKLFVVDDEIPEAEVKAKLNEFRMNNRDLYGQVGKLKAEKEAMEKELADLRKKAGAAGSARAPETRADGGDVDDNFWTNPKVQERLNQELDSRIKPFKTEKEREVQEVRAALEAEQAAKKALEERLDHRYLEEQYLLGMQANNFAAVQPAANEQIKSIVVRNLRKDTDGSIFVVDSEGDTRFSKKNPGRPLSVEEYLQEVSQTYSYLFAPAGGGGSPGSSRVASPSALIQRPNGHASISRTSPNADKAIISNLEQVAKGIIPVKS